MCAKVISWYVRVSPVSMDREALTTACYPPVSRLIYRRISVIPLAPGKSPFYLRISDNSARRIYLFAIAGVIGGKTKGL